MAILQPPPLSKRLGKHISTSVMHSRRCLARLFMTFIPPSLFYGIHTSESKHWYSATASRVAQAVGFIFCRILLHACRQMLALVAPSPSFYMNFREHFLATRANLLVCAQRYPLARHLAAQAPARPRAESSPRANAHWKAPGCGHSLASAQ